MKNALLNKSKTTIGIFDSGLGGLTILNQLDSQFSNHKFIYFGDTAHLPYGTKSNQSIIKFCDNIVEFLISKGAEIIIIACHSASAVALSYLKNKYNIPIIDVITPSIQFILDNINSESICVLGTSTTISSKTYSKKIKKLSDKIYVEEIECPLFVPLVEESLEDSDIASLITKMYIDKIENKNFDTLILGCTHYPILINQIKKIINPNVQIVDTGLSICNELKPILNESNNNINSDNEYYVSDMPYRFNQLASKFLNKEINKVEQIEL